MAFFAVFIFVLVVIEVLLTMQVNKNYRYARRHHNSPRQQRPPCLLIVPCKGLDEMFETNIRSFYEQDYRPYRLWFVVEDAADVACAELRRIKDQYAAQSQVHEVQLLVAGRTVGCSQKLHNLLFACRRAPSDVDVLVFADSDACAGTDWLAQMVWPLDYPDAGLSSGYRWFVPRRNNPATLALSAMNAKVCQLLGKTPFNLAWGGSMAIRKERFERLDIDRLWSASLSDDLSVSRATHKAGLKTYFVPACVVASYVSTTWPQLWEFARRQFVITRIYAPKIWLLGLFGALLSVTAFWSGVALMIGAAMAQPCCGLLYAAAGAVLVACQVIRAVLRQRMAARLLPDAGDALRVARWADWLGFWAWSILLLTVIAASAFGRTITWRGIKYRISSRTDIKLMV